MAFSFHIFGVLGQLKQDWTGLDWDGGGYLVNNMLSTVVPETIPATSPLGSIERQIMMVIFCHGDFACKPSGRG